MSAAAALGRAIWIPRSAEGRPGVPSNEASRAMAQCVGVMPGRFGRDDDRRRREPHAGRERAEASSAAPIVSYDPAFRFGAFRRAVSWHVMLVEPQAEIGRGAHARFYASAERDVHRHDDGAVVYRVEPVEAFAVSGVDKPRLADVAYKLLASESAGKRLVGTHAMQKRELPDERFAKRPAPFREAMPALALRFGAISVFFGAIRHCGALPFVSSSLRLVYRSKVSLG